MPGSAGRPASWRLSGARHCIARSTGASRHPSFGTSCDNTRQREAATEVNQQHRQAPFPLGMLETGTDAPPFTSAQAPAMTRQGCSWHCPHSGIPGPLGRPRAPLSPPDLLQCEQEDRCVDPGRATSRKRRPVKPSPLRKEGHIRCPQQHSHRIPES